ncbi:MAG: SPASM domain-containing protein [Deltaproteobacteria bacterium]|nr:SPASM domain-containing protein [Deltaproteobacteria bacterium]
MGTYRELKRLVRIGKAFRKGETSLSYFPSRIWIELTNHCNLKCPLCPNQNLPKENKGYISPGLFKEIVDQVQGQVNDLYLFHRGESLLHPNLIELIDYAQSRKIPCRIHTNATVLSEAVSKEMLNAGLDVLSFSFDSGRPSLYEKSRYPAKFEKTLGNIKRFLQLKMESRKRKPVTILQMMGIEKNHRELERKPFVSSLKSLGLNRVVLRRPHNWGGAISGPLESPVKQSGPFFSCTFPWYALIVYWNGLVGPCPQDFFARMIMGDLKKKSILEIWNGPEMQELRQKIKDREHRFLDPCRQCDRPRRKTLAGVPTEYVKTFLKENIRGYN